MGSGLIFDGVRRVSRARREAGLLRRHLGHLRRLRALRSRGRSKMVRLRGERRPRQSERREDRSGRHAARVDVFVLSPGAASGERPLAGMLSEAVDRALGRDRFCLVAFAHMPERMHLLEWPMEPYPWASTAGQASSATRAADFHPRPNVSEHLTPLFPTGRLSPGAQHRRGGGTSASFPLLSPSGTAFP